MLQIIHASGGGRAFCVGWFAKLKAKSFVIKVGEFELRHKLLVRFRLALVKVLHLPANLDLELPS